MLLVPMSTTRVVYKIFMRKHSACTSDATSCQDYKGGEDNAHALSAVLGSMDPKCSCS